MLCILKKQQFPILYKASINKLIGMYWKLVILSYFNIIVFIKPFLYIKGNANNYIK